LGDESSDRSARFALGIAAYPSPRVWEIIAKAQIGKLTCPPACGDCLSVKLPGNGILVLQRMVDHVRRVEPLPLHYRDPFDRILITQSTEENPPAITADPWFQPYPAQIIG
jgi:PIN domain nuclease of toxin-antitoxin system